MEHQLGTEGPDLAGRKEVPISKVQPAVGWVGEGMGLADHYSLAVEDWELEVHFQFEGALVSLARTRELPGRWEYL
jgi:hypothetical protein